MLLLSFSLFFFGAPLPFPSFQQGCYFVFILFFKIQEWISYCPCMHGNGTTGLRWIFGFICDRFVLCATKEGAFGGGDTSKVIMGPPL